MTFYQGLAIVLLRVYAFTWIVGGAYRFLVPVLWNLLDKQAFAQTKSYYLFNTSSFALYLTLGIVVWFAAAPLGKRIGRQIPETAAPEISGDALVAIGSFLIGLYFFIEYGAKALGATTTLAIEMAKQTDAERLAQAPILMANDWANLAGNWAIAVLALVLAFRAQGVAHLFGWLRRTGQGAHLDRPEHEGAAD